MKTKINVIRIMWGVFLVLPLCMAFYFSINGKFATAADKAANDSVTCLACHGDSFEKLVSKKPTFKASSNEIINPHQYVPHNEKKAENVPNCTDCHSTHPIPPKEKIDLSKVNADNCFLSCHHTDTFQRCGNCHH